MKKRKTLADVAAAAGVSKMTASRALRGDKDVSQTNIERVTAAAREIGYYGNQFASSLSGKHTGLIGVVVPSLSNVVFAQVMSGVTEALKGSVLQPVFGVTDYDPEVEHQTLRNMMSWRPAGLIVTGLDQPEETGKLLSDAGVPVVQIMDIDGDPIDACVGFSHIKAGYDIATSLIETGLKRIGYIGRNLDKDHRAGKRRQGFQSALQDHGLTFAGTVEGSTSGVAADPASAIAEGRQMTAALLTHHPTLECIYYSNDDLAFGGLCHCIETGIDVPNDLALAGFNGLSLLDGFPGKIATSHTARRDIGERAARIILKALENPDKAGEKVHILEPKVTLGDLFARRA